MNTVAPDGGSRRAGPMADVVWLDGGAACDPALAGGKAAPLARLVGTHPVPPGFCVTTAAHARFAAAVSRACRLPEELAEAVAGAYGRLGSPPVAVRSSASDEDGAESSFAG